MDGTQVWEFGGISGSADTIRSTSAAIAGEQDSIKATLGGLAGCWGGASSETYQALQRRWDQRSAEVNDALRSLCSAIDQANASMQSTEARVGARFM